MKHKLLIIEDNLDLLQMVSLRAKYRGFKCIKDSTGAHCLSKVERWRPDLILMDLDLPKINGIELILQLKNRADWSRIPIIVFSSFSENELVNEVIKLGANTYFVKNGSIDDLLDIIESYVCSNEPQDYSAEFLTEAII